MTKTRDVRVSGYRPLIPPAVLLDELPLSEEGSRAIAGWRSEIAAILDGSDDRLVVVTGPCSVHDVSAGLEYARRLRAVAERLAADLRIVMRVYFEKPRTTVGWKGLINDPRLDGSFDINEGVRLGRKLLLDVADLGLPAGCEFLDPISPQYTSDLVSWGAIGARTTESQVHRELASGLSMPIGFKNGTGGTVQIAIDAVCAAAYPHRFLGVTEQGLAAIVITKGNDECHVILRGGARGPNFDRASVADVLAQLAASGVGERVMVDASHGNSERDHLRQLEVVKDLAAQVAEGQRGIAGVMIESFLVAGRQELPTPDGAPSAGAAPSTETRTPSAATSSGVRDRLTFGQSITDPCIGWGETETALETLAQSVRARRAAQREGRVASTRR
ncbi:MAG: 3-deoxy-7-phosphoheptulonate synthase [Chloroflexota bacterium]|nr:3-deoxy-7-phosphoheptulonate synthase [Chloroflexota bacterium]